jgi:hypothetical protein
MRTYSPDTCICYILHFNLVPSYVEERFANEFEAGLKLRVQALYEVSLKSYFWIISIQRVFQQHHLLIT